MAFAVPWERRREPEADDTVQTFSIITGPPNELVALLHNRVPVILPREAWRRRLGEDETGVDDLRGTLRPSQAELMGVHPIGRRIGTFATTMRIY